MARRSSMLSGRVGGEVAGSGFKVVRRMLYVYSAEITNRKTTSHAMSDDGIPPYHDVLDNGTTFVVERIPMSGHHNKLFEFATAVNYSLFAALATFQMVFTIQPYVLLPLTTAHVNYTTTQRINVGCALLVEVTL